MLLYRMRVLGEGVNGGGISARVR